MKCHNHTVLTKAFALQHAWKTGTKANHWGGTLELHNMALGMLTVNLLTGNR